MKLALISTALMVIFMPIITEGTYLPRRFVAVDVASTKTPIHSDGGREVVALASGGASTVTAMNGVRTPNLYCVTSAKKSGTCACAYRKTGTGWQNCERQYQVSSKPIDWFPSGIGCLVGYTGDLFSSNGMESCSHTSFP